MPTAEGPTGRENYLGGREHSKIKHAFLQTYLEALAFKTLQAQARGTRSHPTFAYIDGFTGPWGAKDENYADTSFGIALDVLKRVKARLPTVTVRCVFCETRKSAFRSLEQHVRENSGSVDAFCVHGQFEQNIARILNFIGPSGFRFAFVDPKGWKVDTSAIAPLLRDQWSEILFTFMSEFVGRFPDFDKVADSYAAFLGSVDWRSRFEALPDQLPNEEKIFLLFRDVLKERWGFQYVLDFPIRKFGRDRVFYKLVYGTRSPHGVITFREAQRKAEKEHFAFSIEAEKTAQLSIFSVDDDAQQIAASVGVGSPQNVSKISGAIISLLSNRRSMDYLNLSAAVLEDIPARDRDVASVLRNLEKSQLVTFTAPNSRGNPSKKSRVSLTR